MDFKSILESEISTKRRLFEEKAGPRKFLRRGDLDNSPSTGMAAVAADVKDEEQRPADCSVDDKSKADEIKAHENSCLKEIVNNQSTVDSPTKRSSGELLVSAMETETISADLLQKDASKTRNLISLFLRRLLREQGERLSQRTEEEQASKEGKLATTVHCQCQDHLRPLCKLLRKNALPKDVLESLVTICGFMQQREYVQANDTYLKLAIGNAPWPIGVTAVGIHERSAQEKIKSNQVARRTFSC